MKTGGWTSPFPPFPAVNLSPLPDIDETSSSASRFGHVTRSGRVVHVAQTPTVVEFEHVVVVESQPLRLARLAVGLVSEPVAGDGLDPILRLPRLAVVG